METRKRQRGADGCSSIITCTAVSSSSSCSFPLCLSPAPLAAVLIGLARAEPRLLPLPHVVELFTELLDASVFVSLVRAAASGSVRLLDRVMRRVSADDNTVDAAQRAYWLAVAMQRALERDDLAIARRLHAFHPRPLYIYTITKTPSNTYGSTLALALKFGTVETVQWVIQNRADRLCCPPGPERLCRGCLLAALPCIGDRDAFRVVMWLIGNRVIKTLDRYTVQCLFQAMQYSTELVEYMDARELLDQSTVLALLLETIKQRRVANSLHLARLLDPHPESTNAIIQCLAMGVSHGMDSVVVQLIVSGLCNPFKDKFVWASVVPGGKKILLWDKRFMARMVRHGSLADVCSEVASSCGDLDTLQWLYYERNVQPDLRCLHRDLHDQASALRIFKWMVEAQIDLPNNLMDLVAEKGYLDAIQWLHANTVGCCWRGAMDRAAKHGHLDMVQWLHTHYPDSCSGDAMAEAAGNGHLQVVQWLYAHRPECYPPSAIRRAADSCHLDVLIWLTQNTTVETCTECVTRAVLRGTPLALGSPRSIDVLRWIRAQPLALCAFCERLERDGSSSRAGALSVAVLHGDLELARFLFSLYRHKLHFTSPAKTVGLVAQAGHLAMLQWVHANLLHRESSGTGDDSFYPPWDGDWTAANYAAAKCGHDHVVAWIHSLEEGINTA